jgi:hypothetical protein
VYSTFLTTALYLQGLENFSEHGSLADAQKLLGDLEELEGSLRK